ncbi:MAG: Aminoglycoside N(6')-acetyltransferase type 1 [Candidatus Ordinivivax streblomastigis]|uniref:Aminoglycoside N(6')-acetyltransferase type 1 n=1 Tax=Candidatus Ordinivivax streblomastigis TaxID=2540710 RepID=A0A5M8P002_9BACT|nr:MAG: Aminoglycoside N(6')-acetyltransferase type 1 [Candidatus Ordinivivax streblomastigis]
MNPIETQIIPCDYTNTDHLNAVALLINAYIDDDMGGGEPLSSLQKLRLVDGLHVHPKSIVLLAERAGDFVGLLTAFENFSTFTAQPMINVHDIFVLKEYRGQGIGKQLLQTLIKEAEDRKASRISLEVRTDNLSAQGLYSSLGFGDTEPAMYYWRKYLSDIVSSNDF